MSKIIFVAIVLLSVSVSVITAQAANVPQTAQTSTSASKTRSNSSATASTASTTASSTVSDAEIESERQKAATAISAYQTARLADRLAKLKEIGAHVIDQRVKSLQQFQSRQFKGLDQTDKDQLMNEAKATVIALESLRAKIQADTTVETAKADVKRIYVEYRVYAVLLPKLNILRATDAIEAAVAKVNQTVPSLEKRVANEKAAGKDVSNLEMVLSDIKKQLSDAASQIKLIRIEVAKMKVGDVLGSQTAAKSARELLRQARADLVAARGDLNNLQKYLKDLATTASSANTTTSTTPATQKQP